MEFRLFAGVSAVVGGLLIALVPLLDGFVSGYMLVVGAIPPLLGVGVYGLYHSYDLRTSDALVMGSGVGLLFLAACIYTVARLAQGSVVFVFLAGLPALCGLLLLGVGSGLFANRLRKLGVMPRWLAVFFGVALPLDPLANALLTPLLTAGVSIYGVAWMAVGWFLLIRPTGQQVVPDASRVQVEP